MAAADGLHVVIVGAGRYPDETGRFALVMHS